MIRILDREVSDVIAAGEVVDSTASLVKELIENSLDAESKKIRIEISNGARDIRVTDDGIGMSLEDLELCTQRHATSKINTKEDLFNLTTYGFRGEALSSISSISKICISTKQRSGQGHRLFTEGVNVIGIEEASLQDGTDINIRDLFFNVPARLKFMRSSDYEHSKIRDIVLKEALASYNVSFELYFDGVKKISTSGNGVDNTILELFNNTILNSLQKGQMAYLGNANISRASREYIFTYFNRRYAKSATVDKAIIDAYNTMLPRGKYPFVILFLELDPSTIDVNVHPSKKVVRFTNEGQVYRVVRSSLEKDLESFERKISAVSFNKDQEHQSNSALSKLEVNNQSENKELNENNLQKYDLKSFSIQDANKKIHFENGKDSKNREYNREDIDSLGKDVSYAEKDSKESSAYPGSKGAYLGSQEYLDSLFKSKDNRVRNEIGSEIGIPEKYRAYGADLEDTERDSTNQYRTVRLKDFESGIHKSNTNNTVDYFVKNIFLGQAFNTFSIVQCEDKIEMYDQHIVQERVLYEELKEAYLNKKIIKQGLLVPIKMNVSVTDRENILDNVEFFNEVGFEVEAFGQKEIVIRTVPHFPFYDSVNNIFKDLIEVLHEKDLDVRDIRDKVLVTMACKQSIKAGDVVTEVEMKRLINKLHRIGKYTCPHGRNIILDLPLLDLEKRFKRK